MTVLFDADRDLTALVADLLATTQHTSEWRSDLDRGLWDQLAELGLTTLLSQQGAGWAEAAVLLEAAASHGRAVPTTEHDILAGWLLEAAGEHDRLEGLVVPATVDAAGGAPVVPWAPRADHVVILSPDAWVHLVPGSFAVRTEHTDLAGRPCGAVLLPAGAGPGTPVPAHTAQVLLLRRRLARCVEITGAMRGAVDLAVAYAGERQQFGRPLTAFQAVQHLLADAAAEQALAAAATRTALGLVEVHAAGPDGVTPDVARAVTIGCSVVSRALGTVSRNTHQVLGAMGTTVEHSLQAVLRPALAWRAELGDVVALERSLGKAALAHHGRLWDWLTG